MYACTLWHEYMLLFFQKRKINSTHSDAQNNGSCFTFLWLSCLKTHLRFWCTNPCNRCFLLFLLFSKKQRGLPILEFLQHRLKLKFISPVSLPWSHAMPNNKMNIMSHLPHTMLRKPQGQDRFLRLL